MSSARHEPPPAHTAHDAELIVLPQKNACNFSSAPTFTNCQSGSQTIIHLPRFARAAIETREMDDRL